MRVKSWFIAVVVLVCATSAGDIYAAPGGGGKGASSGGRPSGMRTGFGSSGLARRAENGRFDSNFGCGNAIWGLGGLGWDVGGYGYGYPGWGYSPFAVGYFPERVPYFSLFPPVYYGHSYYAPAWNSAVNSPWAGNDGNPPAQEATATASSPRPPLRIINPYYVEAKTDKP
jgi:hypothetical protein